MHERASGGIIPLICFFILSDFTSMKILNDLLAVILFFAAYSYTKDIIIATVVALVVGVLQAGFTWLKYKKLDTMQWVSLILIVVMGGATVILRNPVFIKWKPTLLFWIGAAALAVSHLMGKNGLKALMGKEIRLSDSIWRNLTFMWIAYLVFMGLANIAVAYMFTEAQWVNYKLFGSTALMVVFMIAQGFYLSRHLPKESE